MKKKAVSLYIEGTSLKVLEVRGNKIKKWANVPLSPGLVSDGMVNDPEQLAGEIKELLKSQNIKDKKVIAGLSGLHCLYRVITLPTLPRAVLPEAINREAERLLPVALEEFYISWQIISTTAEQTRIFLAAYPRSVTDALAETLHQAGIQPNLDLVPLALARASSEKTAVIVDARWTEADIVIMIDGIPELIRSLSLPGEAQSAEEKLLTVRDELERTIKFYNSSNPEKPLIFDAPIYLSGELGENPELGHSLAERVGYRVLPMPLSLRSPDGFPAAHYMVNTGLALRKLREPAISSRVNLYIKPGQYQRKKSLAKMTVLSSLLIGVILLIFLASQVRSATADTSSIKAKLDIASQGMLLKQKRDISQKQEVAELNKKVAQMEAVYGDLTRISKSFSQQQDTVNIDLKTVMNSAPTALNVTGVNQSSSIWQVTGWTPSEAEVLAYVKKLDTSGRFSKITITTMKKDSSGGMNFTLVLTK